MIHLPSLEQSVLQMDLVQCFPSLGGFVSRFLKIFVKKFFVKSILLFIKKISSNQFHEILPEWNLSMCLYNNPVLRKISEPLQNLHS